MSETLTEKLTSTPEGMRLFQQERVIMEVTELICALMEEEDVSKAELAKRLSTSKANVTQMLDGRRNMTIRTVSDVLFHLGHVLEISDKNLSDAMTHYDQRFHICDVEYIKPQPNIWRFAVPKGRAWQQGQKALKALKNAG